MATYKDLNEINPTEEPFLTGPAVVQQSIFNIFATMRHQRLFRPRFPGESLNEQLFETITDANAFGVLRVLLDLVRNNEPRVEVLQGLTVVRPDFDNNRYNVKLVYNILGYNDQTFQTVGSINQ